MLTGDRRARSHAQRTKRDLRIAVLALCAVGVLSVSAVVEMFRVASRTADYQVALERSIYQRSQIRRVALLYQEAEAAQRGYLLTGNHAFLREFEEARREIDGELAELSIVFSGNDVQRDRSRQLVDLVNARLEQLMAVLERYGLGALMEPAIDPADAEVALRTTASLRTLVEDMVDFEEEDIRATSMRVDAGTRWSRTVMVVQMVSIVLLIASLALVALAYLFHRGRVEQQLVEARESADKANQAKSEFLASMSHEIRTPLTSILGYTELLLEEKLAKHQRQFVERLQVSGASLLALINDILDFSKIEAGEIRLEREPLSLGALIADVLSIVSLDAQRKGIELVRDIDPALPGRVAGDGLRLRQILLNLLSNAVKFTERGTVTLRVRHAGSTAAGELIRFEVEDTGIGIPREQQPFLFSRFSQLDSSIQRRYGGTGLGLAISRNLAELMGGEIGVESEEGRGSTFRVTLPLPLAGDAEAETAAGLAPRHGARGRILLVEDSPQNQELVCTVLRRAGHHVDVAGDGEEALAALRQDTYDLVLMDMQMPRMDGVTATRTIRAMEGPVREVPIIAMTANVVPHDLERFRQAGTDDHIAKPFRIPSLVEKVGHWLAPGEPGGRTGRPRAEGSRVHDPMTLEEARALMGDGWTRAALTRLKENIGAFLAAGTGGPPGPAALKRRAHQMVADAGQLGFSELARSCSELEQACTRGQGVDEALERACESGRRADAELERLLAPARGN